jgi:BirA family biotin operon repressor/biotin-[acetyl-CoA-carboxylase] ligase
VRLLPETEALGYRLVSLDTTASTNDDAIALARGGDPGPVWVVAGEQKAGRGRHGRSWTSPAGNLYASLLLVDPCAAAVAPQLGFVAGLALHEAVEAVTGTGAPRLGLKWPNDLLVDGAKVAGLLLEGHRLRGDALAIVVGCGINVAEAPADTPYPATSLRALRPDLTREELFAEFAGSFARTFAAWRRGASINREDPFGAIRRLWLERATGVGETVKLRLPGADKNGIFEGLDSIGRLRLKTPAGVELIDAGDLYFPNLQRRTAELSSGKAG